MKFAYADPPYIGQAKRHYQCAEIDHMKLLLDLVADYPDGWALSCSSSSLEEILSLCRIYVGHNKVRIGSWVKSFGVFKRNVRPAYMWEPVIFMGGRNPCNGHRATIPERNGKQTTPKDFIIEPITLKKGLVGAKPEKVCNWILDLLNFQPGDELHDLFPGTGVMGRVSGERGGVATIPQESIPEEFLDEEPDPEDCMDCGMCDGCIERSRAYAEEIERESNEHTVFNCRICRTTKCQQTEPKV